MMTIGTASLPFIGLAAASPALAAPAPAAPATAGAGAIPQPTGVFAQESTLPFKAPRFDLIQDTDYQPAIEQGIAIKRAELRAIAENPAPPTFDNTIRALEGSGRFLDRVTSAFSAKQGANTNKVLDATDAATSPLLSALSDDQWLDPQLFARVKALHDARATLNLDAAQARVLQLYYDNFIRSGANLSPADKAKLKDMNARLATLGTEFGQKLTEATRAGALVVDNRGKLTGLSDGDLAGAEQLATQRGLTGKWVIALQNTTQQPALSDLADRPTRQALFEQSIHRADRGDANDTQALVTQIAALRAQVAQLLGFPDYASFRLQDQMARDPKTALAFLQSLVQPVNAAQQREAAEIDKAIAARGLKFTVQPWDWNRYAEDVRKAKFDFDQSQVKPYFEARRVLEDGVFFAANRMYGLTFKRRDDIPAWAPNVWTYTVYDKDGSELGLAYFDLFQRDSKQGGAWMSSLVSGDRMHGDKPVVYNVLNIAPPAPGQPALITADDVTTMFHEFGHALHGLLNDQYWPRLSGTTQARDFVEFPSQFNEHWAWEPTVLANYAKHYQTGAPLPQALVDKLLQSRTFNQGYEEGELLAAALLDMKWHAIAPGTDTGTVTAFENNALGGMGLAVDKVPPRYRSTYFRHVFGGNGYAAGYYAYIWTDMLNWNTYQWFVDNGGMTRANGDRFRQMVLSKGDSIDYDEMFRAFIGHGPDVGPLLRGKGLVQPTD